MALPLAGECVPEVHAGLYLAGECVPEVHAGLYLAGECVPEVHAGAQADGQQVGGGPVDQVEVEVVLQGRRVQHLRGRRGGGRGREEGGDAITDHDSE